MEYKILATGMQIRAPFANDFFEWAKREITSGTVENFDKLEPMANKLRLNVF